LTLFLADVPGEQLREGSQFTLIHCALFGATKILPQLCVLAPEFIDQRGEFRKTASRWKQNVFFCHEMNLNFVRVVLVHLRLPLAKVRGASLKRPFQLHTERQGVLVLMGKRDQAWVAQHGSIILLC
jgi:hypothetical protein